MAGKVVQVIQATVPIVSAQSHSAIKKRRVAGYARVSTEKEEQRLEKTRKCRGREIELTDSRKWEGGPL